MASKLWYTNYTEAEARRSVQESLEKLDIGYLDMMNLNWPGNALYKISDPRNAELRKSAWLALETFVQGGEGAGVRAIGVSNFLPRHLEEIQGYASVPIACNQIELHPLYQE